MIGKEGLHPEHHQALSPNIKLTDGRRMRRVIADQTAEDAEQDDLDEIDDAGFDNFNEREQAILAIVKRYETHPRIAERLAAFRTGKSRGKPINPNRPYSHAMDEFPVLDESEVSRLFIFIEKGLSVYQALNNPNVVSSQEEEALLNLVTVRQLLLLSNLRLVVSIANKYPDFNVLSRDDFIQEGIIGLTKAIHQFDVTQGLSLANYATFLIHLQIRRALGDTGRTIRLPRKVNEALLKMRKTRLEFLSTLNREPTEQEMATATGLSIHKLRLYRQRGAVFLPSLQQKVNDRGTQLIDILSEIGDTPDYVDPIAAKLETARLFASPKLDDREKLVLGLYHGVFDSLPPNLHVLNRRTGKPVDYKNLISKLAATGTNGLMYKEIGVWLGLGESSMAKIGKTALRKALTVIGSM